MEFEDEGGLLRIPQGLEQRQTSSGSAMPDFRPGIHVDNLAGKRHLALMLNPDKHRCYGRPSLDAKVDGTCPKSEDKPPMLPRYRGQGSSGYITLTRCSPDVMDSHVSIAFSEESQYGDVLNSWIASASGEQSRHNTPATLRKPSAHTVRTDTTVRVVEHDLSPIRPAASEPPSPVPDSAVSKPDSHIIECFNRPVKRPFEACRVLSSHPPQKDETLTALPKIALLNEEFPIKHPSPGKEVEIKHPPPRRFASYPVLLQRASSMASSLYPRSISDSPGPPPPRSPLRLRRDPRTIESIIATHNISQTRKATPKLLAQIEPVTEYNEVLEAMKPTVVTDCTGPIKRPRSRNRDSTGRATNQVLCTDRVQRSRARKLRQHPYPSLAVDKAADEAADTGPRRLRKARPQLQIPLKPALLVTRTSSSASSTASWKKSTQSARTPVSPVLSQDSPRSQDTRTGYTPMSPTTSNVSDTMCIALSPVMLVAEEMPVPKTKSTPKLAKVVVKEGKSYVPRPRSASIPRNAMKRRNRAGAEAPPGRTPSRPATPATGRQKDDMPPLPSPPPNRALPPTPPASGSEKPGRRTGDKNGLPVPPAYEIAPKQNKHVACQARRKSNSPKDIPSRTAGLEARLDVLERHNCLLEAALTAVLKVNGKLNGPPRQSQVLELETILSMVWENRVARRSAASQRSVSHAPSGSYESALDMYFATRLGAGAACSA